MTGLRVRWEVHFCHLYSVGEGLLLFHIEWSFWLGYCLDASQQRWFRHVQLGERHLAGHVQNWRAQLSSKFHMEKGKQSQFQCQMSNGSQRKRYRRCDSLSSSVVSLKHLISTVCSYSLKETYFVQGHSMVKDFWTQDNMLMQHLKKNGSMLRHWGCMSEFRTICWMSLVYRPLILTNLFTSLLTHFQKTEEADHISHISASPHHTTENH